MPAKPARKRKAPVARVAARKPAPRRAPHAVAFVLPRTVSLPFIVADNTRSDQLLRVAIVGSIVLHALVLALKFSPLELPTRDPNASQLEVALVNAKSKTKPTKADILAQANLDGGGNTDANRRAKTPLPVLPRDSSHRELAVATRKVEQMENQAKELMAQLRSGASVAPPVSKPSEVPDPADLPSSTEVMQRTLEALRLEAQVAKDMDAYAKRPKRRFVGARAAEYRFARYVEEWRLKVERVGNLNYPEAARARKLYGSLLLTVGIRADGSLESIAVDNASGQKLLDQAATRIVEMASPYAPFPPDIKRDTDILYITRTWTFAPGGALISE